MKGGGAIAIVVLLLLAVFMITGVQNVKDEGMSSAADKAYVAETTKIAFEAYKVEKPWPAVRIVSSKSSMLGSSKAVARAVVFDDGTRSIYVNRKRLKGLNEREIEGTMWHEVAHIRTWERYGTDVAEHGMEFRSICMRAPLQGQCDDLG